MVQDCSFQQWPSRVLAMQRKLPSGNTLIFTETQQVTTFCRIAYSVALDGQYLGKLMLRDIVLVWDMDTVTEQDCWRASTDGVNWTQDLSSQNEALLYLLPISTAC